MAARQEESFPDLDLEDYLPFRLAVTADAVSQLISRAYGERFGLTIPQWRMVAALAAGPRGLEALVQFTRLEPGVAKAALSELTGRRLVQPPSKLLPGDQDHFCLTREGVSQHAQIAPLALAYEAALLTGLSPSEVSQMKRLLGKLATGAARLGGGSARS